MKKLSIIWAFVLLITTVMLSGCIYPYWEDGHYYDGGGGYRHDGYRHDNGRHNGRR